MAGNNNIYNNNDSIDINELASLNEDISDDMLEQLSQQLTQDTAQSELQKTPLNENDDTTLFEEPVQDSTNSDEQKKTEIKIEENFDDNFMKKYKAKLNKQALANSDTAEEAAEEESSDENEPEEAVTQEETIEAVSGGNISERPITPEQKEYNDSLDFLDGNVKYSKYVIYIDPQNINFIESLTVKERKNLINNILHQQDDIALTKQRFKKIQTVIRQVIVAVLTLTISIPVIYYAINASLEATIDNHRRSETNWQMLYKEHGKITRD